jgi:plasmid maintenance system antidote protein VapI
MALELAGSQEALAKSLGIDQGDVSRYVAGLRKCRPLVAKRLEDLLGVPMRLTLPHLYPGEGE